jgi:ATP adenylyltransferase
VDEWTPFLLQEYSFVHACAKISHGDETQLEKMLEVLIRFAFQKANLDPQKALQVSKQCEQEPDGFVSYNVLFTKEWILVVPRKLETFGPISINSVGFAGMMLAKSKSDFEFIQSQNPLTILKQLTF